MATAMAQPEAALAKVPMDTRLVARVVTQGAADRFPSCSPMVLIMVPMSREANRPFAMAPMASMK